MAVSVAVTSPPRLPPPPNIPTHCCWHFHTSRCPCHTSHWLCPPQTHTHTHTSCIHPPPAHRHDIPPPSLTPPPPPTHTPHCCAVGASSVAGLVIRAAGMPRQTHQQRPIAAVIISLNIQNIFDCLAHCTIVLLGLLQMKQTRISVHMRLAWGGGGGVGGTKRQGWRAHTLGVNNGVGSCSKLVRAGSACGGRAWDAMGMPAAAACVGNSRAGSKLPPLLILLPPLLLLLLLPRLPPLLPLPRKCCCCYQGNAAAAARAMLRWPNRMPLTPPPPSRDTEATHVTPPQRQGAF
jgi:hypothetical protein